jgi:hypothetical protein
VAEDEAAFEMDDQTVRAIFNLYPSKILIRICYIVCLLDFPDKIHLMVVAHVKRMYNK